MVIKSPRELPGLLPVVLIIAELFNNLIGNWCHDKNSFLARIGKNVRARDPNFSHKFSPQQRHFCGGGNYKYFAAERRLRVLDSGNRGVRLVGTGSEE